MKDKYSFSKVVARHVELLDERSEWEEEWRNISDYLIPGRGIYQNYTKPQKRKLSSSRVINSAAEDALYVLTSGLHGGLTSPSMPWFSLDWADKNLNDVEPLKAWLQMVTDRVHLALHQSNFYSVINSFYIEYGGFGTGCMYVGENKGDSYLKFELLTAGEYSFAEGADGKPSVFMRPIFKSPRQVVEMFPDTVSEELKKRVENGEGGIDKSELTILESIFKEKYNGKPYTQIYYEHTGSTQDNTTQDKEPLKVSGFYEFPYPIARWGTIGSDIYGIGPGSRSLTDIRRLQEMERAFSMATHKTINPPLNAPGRLRGKLNTLPGGLNYYSNPNETVNELYQVKFDYQGVNISVERIEQRIQRNFFNDIFLTAARDPNASPLKATQVQVQEQEKMLRLGPVIERLQSEFFSPVIERVFNILLRNGAIPPLSPELAQIAGDYNIGLVSPLATAQRGVALNGLNSFMGFLGNAAQLNQEILDNVDPDEAAREHANINGVKLGILRSRDDVKAIRAQRAKAQAAEKKRQEELTMAGFQAELNQKQAETQKTQSEAGLNMVEGQQIASEVGLA